MERGRERETVKERTHSDAVEAADAVLAVLCLLLCRSVCVRMFVPKMIALSVEHPLYLPFINGS